MFATNHRGRNMKKFLTTLAVLTVIATPAFAQSFDPDLGTGNVNPPLASTYGGQRYDSQGLGAYAHDPAPTHVYRGHHLHRRISPTKEQYQTVPNMDENY
jgi:hypothetical protein